MIYRSNLEAPDLQPYFKYAVCRPMPHSYGHDVLSDWADKADNDPVFGLYKKCGFWTHDEAAILYQIVKQTRGRWLDIGAHTGWTACHAALAADSVFAVDNMFAYSEAGAYPFLDRYRLNLGRVETGFHRKVNAWANSASTSKDFLRFSAERFTGVIIDGDHEHPVPLEDAQGALRHIEETGIVLFHDASGEPVQKAARWLISQGFKHRTYFTPHIVVCCWRGEFEPPEHKPDARVAAAVGQYLRGL